VWRAGAAGSAGRGGSRFFLSKNVFFGGGAAFRGLFLWACVGACVRVCSTHAFERGGGNTGRGVGISRGDIPKRVVEVQNA
jgi:hypothetical protein